VNTAVALVANTGNSEQTAVAFVANTGNSELAAVALVITALPPVTVTTTTALDA